MITETQRQVQRGWNAVNLETHRAIHILGSQRLRFEIRAPEEKQ